SSSARPSGGCCATRRSDGPTWCSSGCSPVPTGRPGSRCGRRSSPSPPPSAPGSARPGADLGPPRAALLVGGGDGERGGAGEAAGELVDAEGAAARPDLEELAGGEADGAAVAHREAGPERPHRSGPAGLRREQGRRGPHVQHVDVAPVEDPVAPESEAAGLVD